MVLSERRLLGAYLGSRHGVSMQAIAGEAPAWSRTRFLLRAACR
jgi:hypothetical protein